MGNYWITKANEEHKGIGQIRVDISDILTPQYQRALVKELMQRAFKRYLASQYQIDPDEWKCE